MTGALEAFLREREKRPRIFLVSHKPDAIRYLEALQEREPLLDEYFAERLRKALRASP